MIGKPPLHASHLVNVEVVKDDMNLPCCVMGDNVLQKLNEVNGWFSVADEMHTCSSVDALRPEYAILLARAGHLNPHLLATQPPRGS